MPDDWAVFGTTGYVFLNSVNSIFVDLRNGKAFDRIYSQFIKSNVTFQDIAYEKKKLVMQVAMSGEISTLGHNLNALAEKRRHTRDFTLNSLTRAVVEVIAFFPVYRTYITTWIVKDRDRQHIESAIAKAKRKNPAINASVFDFLRDVLLLRFPDDLGEEDKREWLNFVMKFQQITGPVAAKGVEDTAFYVYNRLASLNEVGGSPDRFGSSLESFHGQNLDRCKFWPHAFITTSTHDTKRSEDVRARINVLSEIPEHWRERLMRWGRLNRRKKLPVEGQFVPDRNEEYLLYQTLIGAWPVGPMTGAGYDFFKRRILDYMVKAVREAKINTSWISPNASYEEALSSFIDTIMTDAADNTFLKEFEPFQRMVSHHGMFNSLSQTLLKIASPGVADFYQGTEVWDFSLVDPDNRRPVDYPMRMKLLDDLGKRESEVGQLELARDLTVNKEDGRIKLYLIHKALNHRRENRRVFEGGEYVPIEADGEKADCVCAFARRTENSAVLVIAPRFITKLVEESGGSPLGRAVWGDSSIAVPFENPGAQYRNL
ncbi:MAG TPA: malto-oligosyltrehalose synthase, partial [Desulfatiglandales bacterium]|nr:malto-oligosyltrehalose synthase [Desulfatiglandales bacterium]